jgi:predicted MFS family arabinose efflux permease
LRVVLDRNRGGSYLAIGIAGAGMFGVFLFLTYYLQQTLGYTPIETGFAFLPMLGAVMLTATMSTAALLPRVGPRPLLVRLSRRRHLPRPGRTSSASGARPPPRRAGRNGRRCR